LIAMMDASLIVATLLMFAVQTTVSMLITAPGRAGKALARVDSPGLKCRGATICMTRSAMTPPCAPTRRSMPMMEAASYPTRGREAPQLFPNLMGKIVPKVDPAKADAAPSEASVDYLYPARFPPNKSYPAVGDFEVKRFSDEVGMGVISYRGFQPGDLVAAINGDQTSEILQHTLQIREGLHNHDPFFSGYFLHSCSPNVFVDMEKMEVRCLREIKPNEWLYMDYAQTEDHLFACFQCSCASPNCRKVVTGRMQVMEDVASSVLWWKRDGLSYDDNQLQFAGRNVNELAAQHGTPCFVYDAERVESNAKRMSGALDDAGFKGRHRVMYAMKANRFAPLLTFLKLRGAVAGLDVCSPREIHHAMGCGFEAHELSFTSTSLSRKDIESISAYKGLHVNLDSLSALRRWGELGHSREVGLRINPAMGVGREDNDMLQYSGPRKTTKFGIYKEQMAEAMSIANEFGLTITRIHFHTGCGYLTPQLPIFDAILEECIPFIEACKDTCRQVILGGGMGVPFTADDSELDLSQWAEVIAKHFAARDLEVWLEPGSYLAQDAGLLLLTANSVEAKADKIFVGVDGGFNLAPEPAMYALPFQPVPATWKPDSPLHTLSIAGNINEALDVWFEDTELPEVEEDDVIALLNAGAYSSSMAADHCLRGDFKEVMLL